MNRVLTFIAALIIGEAVFNYGYEKGRLSLTSAIIKAMNEAEEDATYQQTIFNGMEDCLCGCKEGTTLDPNDIK